MASGSGAASSAVLSAVAPHVARSMQASLQRRELRAGEAQPKVLILLFGCCLLC